MEVIQIEGIFLGGLFKLRILVCPALVSFYCSFSSSSSSSSSSFVNSSDKAFFGLTAKVHVEGRYTTTKEILVLRPARLHGL